MDDNDDLDLKNALRHDDQFDSAQAASLRQSARERYSKSMRYITRYLNVTVVVTTMFVAFCLAFLVVNNNERLRTLAICYLVIAMLTGVLVKLWYWTVNTKIAILREIKETFLLSAAGGLQVGPQQDENPVPRPVKRWVLVYIFVSVVSALAGVYAGYRLAEPTGSLRTTSTVQADGTCTSVVETAFINERDVPLTEMTFNSQITSEERRFSDEEGRSLPVSIEQRNNTNFYTIKFIKPVMPGQWLWLRDENTYVSKGAADGDVRVLEWTNGVPGTKVVYTYTFILPPKTEVVSPVPDYAETTADGCPKVTYRNTRFGSSRPFPFVLKYRLVP